MTAKPLVSILIPAYKAEATIGETIESALAQTWPRKEIIVVDDGSGDETAAVARRYASRGVAVVTVSNRGAAAARNYALELSQGDYIQWLDADDLLQPDKIARQLDAIAGDGGQRILISSPWAHFYYRRRNARFIQNSLCEDLSPAEWLLRKMEGNLHMQTGTWLTSRDLVEAAGPWDTRMLSDDDGEYFCRVLLASSGTRFVSDTGVYYRMSPSSRLSVIGKSRRKQDSMCLSMKLHIGYLRSLEDSPRVHRACRTYLQNWYGTFYLSRPNLSCELQALAIQLGGALTEPCLRPKYAWMIPLFGRTIAQEAQSTLPFIKANVARHIDKLMYSLGVSAGHTA